MAQSDGLRVAIHDEDFGWVGSAYGMKVVGEGGDKFTFGSISVETDVEGLCEFEAPLWERARVYRMQIFVGASMRVDILGYSVILLLVG